MVGVEALAHYAQPGNNVTDIIFPFRRGEVNDWEAMERVTRSLFLLLTSVCPCGRVTCFLRGVWIAFGPAPKESFTSHRTPPPLCCLQIWMECFSRHLGVCPENHAVMLGQQRSILSNVSSEEHRALAAGSLAVGGVG